MIGTKEKIFNSQSKELRITEYDNEKPDIQIEDNQEYGFYLYEFDSKEQLDEIIEYLLGVRERWS